MKFGILLLFTIYCLHKYPPLPGPGAKLSPIQTFLSDLLDLKLLNSGLKCHMICQKKSKKNRGAQNNSNEPRTNPPSGVSKCKEFSELWDGGVETKKYAGPKKVRPWRAPKIPVERKLNTVFIFAPRGDHSRAFSAKQLPSTTPTIPHTTILACVLSNSEVRGG